MDITPRLEEGRLVIEAYGGGGFRIGGVSHDGSVIVVEDRVVAWRASDVAALTLADLEPVREAAGVELLLVGSGTRTVLLPRPLREGLAAAGLPVEVMDTGAACRTFNVLALEGRRAAAALIAVA